MADLLSVALDSDTTFEGSRLTLAGRFGEKISIKLDNLLLMLRVMIDLFCIAARIPETQKNGAFQRAATDLQFEQRLTDLRTFYHEKATSNDHHAGTETTEADL